MRTRTIAGTVLAVTSLAACGGGGTTLGTSGGNSFHTMPPVTTPTTAATMTPATQQIIRLALPSTAIGQEVDPTFGLIGGYTQNTFSQVLGFVPGARVMIENAQSNGIPHTLGDTGASSFPSGQPAALSFTRTGSSTFSSGWQSGTLNSGQLIGPITLNAGTYFIGCAYHYVSNNMRDVLVVADNAQPGPQATQPPGVPSPQPTTPGGTGGGY